MPAIKNPLAVALGQLAAAKLTPRQRTVKARKAAQARWAKETARTGRTQPIVSRRSIPQPDR